MSDSPYILTLRIQVCLSLERGSLMYLRFELTDSVEVPCTGSSGIGGLTFGFFIVALLILAVSKSRSAGVRPLSQSLYSWWQCYFDLLVIDTPANKPLKQSSSDQTRVFLRMQPYSTHVWNYLGQFYKSFNGRNLPEPSTEKEKVYLA
jgi:hypothetical protein